MSTPAQAVGSRQGQSRAGQFSPTGAIPATLLAIARLENEGTPATAIQVGLDLAIPAGTADSRIRRAVDEGWAAHDRELGGYRLTEYGQAQIADGGSPAT